MSEQFKVGDVCIGQNLTKDTDYNGVECIIIEPLRERANLWHRSDPDRTYTGLRYRVQWADGRVSMCAPQYLRRKQPPKPAREIDATVSWPDCAWQPSGVVA